MIAGDRAARATGPQFRRWVVVALLLLSFGLRVHRLEDQRVWWDEGWSVWAARFAPADILRETGNDVHPPLYFLLLHGWRIGSGDSEFGLRYLSAVLGTLTVALTFSLGRSVGRVQGRTAGWAVGALAALFLSISRFAIAWSQEIRMYAPAAFLAALALWAARRVWERDDRISRLVYVAAMTAGLYTLYLFFPVLAAANLAWFWVLREATDRRRAFLRWVALQAVVALLFLPWAVYAAGGFLSTASATPIRVIDFLQIYWTALTVGIPLDVSRYARLTLPALLIFLLGVGALVAQAIRSAGDRRLRLARDLTLFLAVLLLPAVIVYIISLPRQNFYNPPFNPRYLVIFAPFYSIVLGWGLIALGQLATRSVRSHNARRLLRRAIPFLTAAFMLGVALVGLWPYYPGRVLVDDYPSLTGTIDAYRQPDDAVILYTDTDWPIFAYHYPESWRGVPHLWTITPQTAADYLAPIWEAHDAVWLATTPYSVAGDPQRHIPAWLADRAKAIREFSYRDMALTLYARTDERAATADRLAQPAPPEPLDIALPSGGRVLGYGQAARDFKSGDAIHLFLYHQGGERIDAEVGLIDDRNQVWGVTPVSLPSAAETARRQIDVLAPPEAPSGRYRFYILDENGRPAPFGELTIRQKQTAYLFEDDVVIANRVGAPFGDGIRLLGYDLASETTRPGEMINLRLYWSSDGDIRQRYKVFTHLLGDVFNAASGNFLWGQVDNEPAANTRPTTTWRGAEVIVDEYAIPVADDAPPGKYRIEIGLYDPATGTRLPLLGPDGAPAADHLILTGVEVVP